MATLVVRSVTRWSSSPFARRCARSRACSASRWTSSRPMLRPVPVTALLVAMMALAMMVPCIQAAERRRMEERARVPLPAAVRHLHGRSRWALLLRPMRVRRDFRSTSLLTLLLVWLLLPIFAAIPRSPAYAECRCGRCVVRDGRRADDDRRYASLPDRPRFRTPSTSGAGSCRLDGRAADAARGLRRPRAAAPGRFRDPGGGGQGCFGARTQSICGLPCRFPQSHGPGAAHHPADLSRPDFVLAIAFSALDKPGLIAAVHAMSIVSTSGIIAGRTAGFAIRWQLLPAELIAVALHGAWRRPACSYRRNRSRDATSRGLAARPRASG